MTPDPPPDSAPGASDGPPAPFDGRNGTIVYGVLGGIASGKSTVGAVLAGDSGVVLSADAAAHEALGSDEVRAKLVHRFGAHVVGADGQVDRAALARVVFEDPDARKILEGWIHPVVRATLRSSLEDALRRSVPRVVLDVPLLLENAEEHGLLELCDHLVFVDAPLEARDQRAVRDRGWDPGEVARREAAQMPLATKRERADVVIVNDGDREALETRTRQALQRLHGD